METRLTDITKEGWEVYQKEVVASTSDAMEGGGETGEGHAAERVRRRQRAAIAAAAAVAENHSQRAEKEADTPGEDDGDEGGSDGEGRRRGEEMEGVEGGGGGGGGGGAGTMGGGDESDEEDEWEDPYQMEMDMEVEAHAAFERECAEHEAREKGGEDENGHVASTAAHRPEAEERMRTSEELWQDMDDEDI